MATYSKVVARLKNRCNAESAARSLEFGVAQLIDGLLAVNLGAAEDYEPAAANVRDLRDIEARLAAISADLRAIAERS